MHNLDAKYSTWPGFKPSIVSDHNHLFVGYIGLKRPFSKTSKLTNTIIQIIQRLQKWRISALQTLLKNTTTLFSVSDHYILSRKWRVIVDQVKTNIMVGLWY